MPGYCTKPTLSLARLPNQNLHRQINGDAASGQHNRSSRLGAAEDQQFGGPVEFVGVTSEMERQIAREIALETKSLQRPVKRTTKKKRTRAKSQ
jgi:hypothetical protein